MKLGDRALAAYIEPPPDHVQVGPGPNSMLSEVRDTMQKIGLAFCCAVMMLAMLIGCRSGDRSVSSQPELKGAWLKVRAGLPATLHALAANDTLLLGVGNGGKIFSSSNGSSWREERLSGPDDDLTSLVWTGTQFVAVGRNGTVISSPDAITWTPRDPQTKINLNAVAYSGGQLCAAGDSSLVLSSIDGVNWTQVHFDRATSLRGLMYADNIWLAAGTNGKILRSSDGVEWSEQLTVMPGSMLFRSLAWYDDQFYAIGLDTTDQPGNRAYVYRSENGSTWFFVSRLDAHYIWDLEATSRGLIAVGSAVNYSVDQPDGLVFSSVDGTAWIRQASRSPFSLYDICFFNDQLFAVGAHGYVLGGSNATDMPILISGGDLTDVAWDGSRFVAVTNLGTLLTSPEGQRWSESAARATASFDRIIATHDRMVALGGSSPPHSIYTSINGQSWVESLGPVATELTDLISGGSLFVAISATGEIFVSNDALIWSRQVVAESASLSTIGWTGTQFVVLGGTSAYLSAEGVNWRTEKLLTSTPPPSFERVIRFGNNLVAIGARTTQNDREAVAAWSNDGISWETIELGKGFGLTSLVRHDEALFAAGDGGQLFYSPDGRQWIEQKSPTGVDLTGLASSGSTLVAVGSGRTILVFP